MARTKKQTGPTCEWQAMCDGEYWDTACGEAFTFLVDGPRENRIQFCPYCGRRLVARCVVKS